MRKKMNTTANLGKAPIRSLVLQLAIPSMTAQFVNVLYSIIDRMYIGHISENGALALAGAGVCGPIVTLLTSFGTLIGIGGSITMGIRMGEKNHKKAEQVLSNSFLMLSIFSVLLTISFLLLKDKLLMWFGASEATFPFANTYLTIYTTGTFFALMATGLNYFINCQGFPLVGMFTVLIGAGCNILLDPIFIFGFHMGISGAAIATVSGTVVACIMSILSIRKKESFISIPYIIEEKIRPTFSAMMHLVNVGYSVFFEQILMRVGFMMTALMAADQGTDAMAAHQVGMNIMGLSFAFGDGLQSAAVALIGRSLGEKDPDLAREYGKTCRQIGAVIAVFLVAFYFFGARLLFGLFFTEEHIIEIGVNIMHVIIFVVIFQICQVIYMGCLRGAGDTLYTAIVSTISVTFIRTLTSYFFGYVVGWGIVGIWFGVLFDQVSRYIFATIRFRQGNWVKIKI